MDAGRTWALQTFGADGVRIREQVPEILLDCHTKMANAQAEAQMSHTGPYGYIWKKALDEFVTQLGLLPSAEIVSLYRSPYKLVAFGDVVLFPWRFSRDLFSDPSEAKFAVSDARISIFTKRPRRAHTRLDIPFEHEELTAEEQEILQDEEKLLAKVLETHPRVVVVAYSSNPKSLNSIFWGEASLSEDGSLTFMGGEALLPSPHGQLVGVESASFDSGEIPRAELGVKELGTEGQKA